MGVWHGEGGGEGGVEWGTSPVRVGLPDLVLRISLLFFDTAYLFLTEALNVTVIFKMRQLGAYQLLHSKGKKVEFEQ